MRTRAIRSSVVALSLIAALAARGNDELDEPMAGNRMKIVSSGGLSEHDMTFRLRPTAVLDLPDVPGNDPTVEGATLVVTDTGDPTRTRTLALPASGWRRFGLAPNFRFVYRGPVTPEEPCVSLRITQRRITGHCGATQKAAGQAVLGPPFVGAASLVLTVGADSKRYCALFGGTTIKNEQSQNVSFLRVNADPPGACPPPPTTTTMP